MTRLAKAMSAFTFGRSAQRAAGRDAFSFAGRGASSGSGGSGAPSHAHAYWVGSDHPYRVSLGLAVLLAGALLALAFASTASAATKFYSGSTIGTTSALSSGLPPTPSGTAFGGTFGTGNGGVGDIAVNHTAEADAHDGWIYVVDRGNNRIQAFDDSLEFQWAIGRDVIAPTVNETQILNVNATGGQFQLCYEAVCTGDLAHNASASTIQTAVRNLATIGGSNVNITGTALSGSNPDGRYAIAFVSALAASPRDEITVQDGTTPLEGTAEVSTFVDGVAVTPGDQGAVFEKCTVAGHCKAGATGSLGGEFDGATGIAIDQSSGNFYVRERNNNRRVQEFTADGEFVRAFGWDVVQPGGTGEVVTDVDEIQEIKLLPPGAGGFLVGKITGGSFTISFDPGTGVQTTAPIPFNAPANPDPENPGATLSVLEALEALPAFGSGDVTVTSPNDGGGTEPGGPWRVAFSGPYAATDLDPLVADPANLVGQDFLGNPAASSMDVATIVNGATDMPGFETCTEPLECKAAPSGVQPGQFGSFTANTTTGIAVAPPGAPNAGIVYVADPAVDQCRVLPFDVSGQAVVALEPFGRCNDRGSTSNGLAVPSTSDQFANGIAPLHLAVGADGTVYATNRQGANGAYVNRHDTIVGQWLPRISGGGSGGPLGTGQPTALALDPASGHLLVGRSGSLGVMEFDLSESPEVVEDAHLVDAHVPSLGATILALGAGGSPSRYFLSTSTSVNGSGSGHRVLVLDEAGVQPPPDIAIDPPEDVTSTTATFRAEIDPVITTNFQTFYRWQIQRVAKEGGFVGDPDFLDVTSNAIVPPDGFTKAEVTHAATALEPNTLYRLRVRAERQPAAGTYSSAAQLFSTEPMAPVVETRAAQHTTDSTVQLVGRLNPGGLSATYWFEYGHSGLTESAPAPAAIASGGSDRLVGETLTGLVAQTDYEFRLCAQNSLSGVKVCDDVKSFHTRSAPVSPAPGRALELVTSPDKPLRRGGSPGHGVDYAHAELSWPAPTGGRVMWSLFAGATAEDAGTGFTWDTQSDLYTRQPGGSWRPTAVHNTSIPEPGGIAAVVSRWEGASANLDLTAYSLFASPFEGGLSNSPLALRDMRSAGGPLGKGWFPWLHPDWAFASSSPTNNNNIIPVVNDAADRLVAISGDTDPSDGFRDVTPADGGPAPQTSVDPSHPVLLPSQTSGRAIFATGPEFDWRPADLVNECTGEPGGGGAPADAPTALPTRLGSGAATDTLGVRECSAGAPVSVHGATIGSRTAGRLGRSTKMAMSDDGSRIFFASPDGGPTACAAATGDATDCPAQLFVRQYGKGWEEPVVRWISRAEDQLFDAPQQIGLLGNGVAFEGASRDGSVVYFRTNAPLTVDDPNGGAQLPGGHTTGTASPLSWDLYRYELPAAPADPAGGTLTRVSGGPDGNADPNTNCSESGATCGGASNGAGNALRFLSDDGERAYFVTAGRIGSGSDPVNLPPLGSAETNVPLDAPSANTATRNLYLHDNSTDAYRFVASIPFDLPGDSVDACASSTGFAAGTIRTVGSLGAGGNRIDPRGERDCVFGSPAGDAVVFESRGQLTADDRDEALDVYLYDAAAHRLTRLTAPPIGSVPYTCLTTQSGSPTLACNGELGFSGSSKDVPSVAGASGSRQWSTGSSGSGNLESVFFQSRYALSEGAADNDAMKVYEWRREGGRISLVSPAGANISAFYSGNSQDGRDVYFWTEQRISPWEVDDADGDIYNATTRTDLRADPPLPPPACAVLANVCQGPPPAAPDANRASTSAISGVGNFRGPESGPKPRCNRKQVRRGNRCVAKRKLARRCRKQKGAAKRRCITRQVRRLSRTANANRRAGR